MPTSERHDAAVRAATAEHRATAVGPTALPQLGTRALDTVRVLSAAELDRLLAQQAELEATIGTAAERAADARAVAAAADARIQQASARGTTCTTDAAVAADRMVAVESRLIEWSEDHARAERRVEVVSRLRDGIDAVLASCIGRSLDAEEVRTTAAALEQLAETATGEGCDQVATALQTWALQLRDDTAALQPAATSLLVALAGLEAEWDLHGRGDLLADPAVRELQATLDEARGLRDDIEAQASEGVLGARAMSSIRTANAKRTELEALGNKADADSLRAAIDAETEALQSVGFDSMLDLHIAMSTGGAGTLVDARRATAAQRVAELEVELARLLAATVALQGELGDRFDALRAQADQLVGGIGTRLVPEALRGLLVVPDALRHAREDLDVDLVSTLAVLESLQAEEAQLSAEASALDLRHAVALAGVREATDELEHARRTVVAAQAEAAVAEQAIEHLGTRSAELATQVEAATRAVDEVAVARYLEADRCELSAALLATLFGHATWLAGQAHAADGTGPTAMVVDDPLDELEEDDALLVLDELIAVSWPTPVVYVTSRPRLVQRLRRAAGDLRAVDGRRKPGAQGAWRRRRDADAALPR